MISLEPKEQLVFDYIRENIRKNGYSPSIRDICTALDIKSTSTVHTCLERLEKKGYIQKENGKRNLHDRIQQCQRRQFVQHMQGIHLQKQRDHNTGKLNEYHGHIQGLHQLLTEKAESRNAVRTGHHQKSCQNQGHNHNINRVFQVGKQI